MSESSYQAVQPRGGGGGGYGGGGGGYGASEYVDPYVVLASLGFGVFLFNLIYDLLNRSARSIDVSDMNIPLHLSDRPESLGFTYAEQVLGLKSWPSGLLMMSMTDENNNNNMDEGQSSRRLHLLDKSLLTGHRVAEAIRRNPSVCSKTLLCKLGNDAIAWNRQPAIVLRAMQLYISWLAHHFGEENVAQFVDQLETGGGNKTICHQLEKPQLSQPVDCNEIDFMSLF